ncbi:ArsR/SmtB family transcription factor [Microbacterium sp. LMI1-1-1.1]|uniref:ArsR/SmtB family transcription factor n=1 Tax=Microbacterium sp. LMI1-1-1.1 TaxID=3135223 RepID=UPI0034663A0B
MTDLEHLARIFTALGHGRRLELMSHVMSTPPDELRSVSSLAAALEISRFTASHHLAILRAADLIDARKVGLTVAHRVKTDTLLKVEDWCISLVDV